MNHVAKNIGGIYETLKSVEEKGDVYTATPVAMQKSAMSFLHNQLFVTPKWLLDNNILNKISNPVANERVQNVQANVLKSLLDKNRLYRLTTSQVRFGASTYAMHDMMEDLRKGLFTELNSHASTDVFRRNLQKTYVSALGDLIDPPATNAPAGFSMLPTSDVKNTDVISEAKSQLKKLASSIAANKSSFGDGATVSHLEDLQDRIKQILDPK
jgi:hypothetical protein